MTSEGTIEAEIRRCRRQLAEVRAPAAIRLLEGRLAGLERQLEAVKASGRSQARGADRADPNQPARRAKVI